MFSELVLSIVTLRLSEVTTRKRGRTNARIGLERPSGAGVGWRNGLAIPSWGVRGYRYRRCRCRNAFRHYPEGIDRARQTAQMRGPAVIGRILGIALSRMSSGWSSWKVCQEGFDLGSTHLSRMAFVMKQDIALYTWWT